MCCLGAQPNPKSRYQSHMVSSLSFWGEGVWILWNLGLFPESHRCSVHGAKENGCWQAHTFTYTPSHACEHRSGLQYIFSVYTFSQNCSVRQESLCHTPNRDIHAESLSGLLKNTQQSEDSCVCVYMNTVYLLD